MTRTRQGLQWVDEVQSEPGKRAGSCLQMECPETKSILGADAGKVIRHQIIEDPEFPSRKPGVYFVARGRHSRFLRRG